MFCAKCSCVACTAHGVRSQAMVVHCGVAGAREALAQPRDDAAANPGDGPLGEADIADGDLGQFIRTSEEIELLGLLRSHLHRSQEEQDDDDEQPQASELAPSTDLVDA